MDNVFILNYLAQYYVNDISEEQCIPEYSQRYVQMHVGWHLFGMQAQTLPALWRTYRCQFVHRQILYRCILQWHPTKEKVKKERVNKLYPKVNRY